MREFVRGQEVLVALPVDKPVFPNETHWVPGVVFSVNPEDPHLVEIEIRQVAVFDTRRVDVDWAEEL